MKYFIKIFFLFLIFKVNFVFAEIIKPNKKLDPYDVIKIQLDALKNNGNDDLGIEQTWLFAHPDNKKVTGPYAKFRIMIYGQQYKHLINHDSHKIKLITNIYQFSQLQFMYLAQGYPTRLVC